MRRVLWLAVGAAATVGTLRAAREVRSTYVPAGARSALGAAARLTGVAQRVAAEFRAGRAQREAELRADLLAGADLTRVRAHVDTWRTGRAEPTDPDDPARTDPGDPVRAAARDTDDDGRLRPAFAPGVPRPGSAAAAGGTVAGASAAGSTRRRARGSHRAEDGDDGPLGYSFF